MSDGTHPQNADTTGSEEILYINIQHLIMQGNNFNDKDDLSLIYDMRQFNICGKNETRDSYLYWKAEIRAMYTESAHEIHERRHAAGDSYANNRISNDPLISTNNLIKITIQLLEWTEARC